jgi:hypothetical protein
MTDLEDRLRAAVGRRSDVFEPSTDLADRIDERVRRRQRHYHVVQGGLMAAAAAAVAVVAVVALDRNDGESIRTTDDDSDLSTRPPATSTTSPPVTPPTSTSPPTPTSTPTGSTTAGPGPGPGIDAATQTRRGIGPITAGMTVRQAQNAAGITLTPAPVGDGSCFEAPFATADVGIVLVIEAAGADPMDGLVRAVAGSVMPSAEGAMVGQTRTELLASLGQPTRTEPGPSDVGGEVLVFEQDGYAYGAFVLDDLVLGLQSGDPAWIADPDGCPT